MVENTTGDGLSWVKTTIDESFPSALSVYAADLDGDGDTDVLGASFDGGGIRWWENAAGDGSVWNEHAVDESLGLAVLVHAGDVDGDGDADVLGASWGNSEVQWWENRGGQFALATADAAPMLPADGETVAALEITATHRGRTGDHDVELATLELLLEDGAGTALTDGETDALLASLAIYLDDGSGTFEPASDTLVESVSSFTLASGVLTVPFIDGTEAVQIPFGTPKTYFVALEFEATASTAEPDAIQVTHLTESSSTGEDAEHDLPATLEFAEDVMSVGIEVNDPPVATDDMASLLEDSGSVSGNVLDGTSGGLDVDEESATVDGSAGGRSVQRDAERRPDGRWELHVHPEPGLQRHGHVHVPGVRRLAAEQRRYRHDHGGSGERRPELQRAGESYVERGCRCSERGGLRERDQRRPGGRIEPDRDFYGDGQHEPGALQRLPVMATDGTLTYTAAADVNGTATVTVELMDDGGTANGGADTSAPQSFDVVVGSVNDAPSFNVQASHTSSEDAGAQSVAGFASSISAGPANESSQTVSFTVTDNTNPALFAAGPTLNGDGTLTYTTAADGNGTATVTVVLMDDGGTANGGVDTSASQSFEITIESINDAPSFNVPANHTSNEDAGAQSVAGFASAISAGPADESSQTVTFTVTGNTNPALFSELPVLANDGALTYTAVADASGTATVTVELMDDGGTANGGVDTSAPQSFDVVVGAVNDVPSFNMQGEPHVERGCGCAERDGLRERDQRRSGRRVEPDRELHGDGQHEPGALCRRSDAR